MSTLREEMRGVFGQTMCSTYNYNNEDFIHYPLIIMFETLKNEALEAKNAITTLKPETSSEQKSQIEKSFVEKTKAREDAIVTAEKTNDATQTEALTKSKADFVEFQKDYTAEMKALIDGKTTEIAEVTTEKSTELSNLGAEINMNKNIDLTTLSGKSRSELWQTPGYISKIQDIILQTGAKHNKIAETKLTDGIFGPGVKAGVKTIQNYLNETYKTSLIVDGIPGENTLAALLSPVSDTDQTSRLDKMLAEKPTFTKIFELQVSSNANKKEATNSTKDKTSTSKETPLDIEGANKEIPEKVLNDIIAKLKKLYPKTLKDEAFIKTWAIALHNNKDKHTYFTYNKVRYWFEGTKYVPAAEKIKSEKNKSEKAPKSSIVENIGETNKIDNNILQVAQTEIQYNLLNYVKNNPINFTGPNARHYNKYYEDNILSLKKPKISISSLNDTKQTIKITLLDSNWAKYDISIRPTHYIKKGDYSINLKTINETIQEDIMKKVDAQLNTKEQQKLEEKYRLLEEYLEYYAFPIDYLYSKEEQIPLVKAFFQDFTDRKLDFNNGDSKFIKSSKTIELELENNGSRNFGTIKMSIEDKFNSDNTINKEKVKEDLRKLIDFKIQRIYPSYVPGKKYS